MNFLFILMIGLALGYYTVCRVPSVFHAPLMSLTNGVSSVCILIIFDQIVQISGIEGGAFWILSLSAIAMLCLNIAGGFCITEKMIAFFYPSATDKNCILRYSVFLGSGLIAFLGLWFVFLCVNHWI